MEKTDSMKRCAWVTPGDILYETYHDTEWGVPVHDDRTMFEFLVLESAQAGLSWRTVLKKREAYRQAFASFDPKKVARLTETDIAQLMAHPGIIRNRLKIRAAIGNAQSFLKIQKEFGSFVKYIWGFVGNQTIRKVRRTMRDVPAVTPEAKALAQDMKQRGFKFFGPTIAYAYMQATGLIDDHTIDCFRSEKRKTLVKTKKRS